MGCGCSFWLPAGASLAARAAALVARVAMSCDGAVVDVWPWPGRGSESDPVSVNSVDAQTCGPFLRLSACTQPAWVLSHEAVKQPVVPCSGCGIAIAPQWRLGCRVGPVFGRLPRAGKRGHMEGFVRTSNFGHRIAPAIARRIA